MRSRETELNRNKSEKETPTQERVPMRMSDVAFAVGYYGEAVGYYGLAPG